MAIYQLPKKLHPDFNRPNLKPKCGVELDLSNRLTKNLLLSVEMTEGAGAPIDLVTGKHLSENGQGWSISGGDRETTYTASGDNSVDITGLSDFAGSAHTLHMRVRVSAYDNSGTVIFGWNNNGSHFWQVDDVSTTVFVAGSELNTLKLSHEGATNNYRDWFFVSDPATNETRFYENGVLLNTKNNAVAIPSGSKDIKIGRWAGSNTFSLDGGIKFCRAWNRALTEAERISLLNDPYQILKPKTPQFYFVPISGGGGSPVSSTLQLNWSALQAASGSFQVVWDALQGTSNQTQIDWNLLNAVSNSIQIDWDALQSVVNSAVFQYVLVETVSGSTQIDWNLLASISSVSNSTRIDWSLISNISQAAQIDWNLLIGASNGSELRWSLLNQIGQNLGIEWSLLAGVNSTIQLDWDLLSNLSSVSNSFQAQWSLISQINAQLESQWNLLNAVGVSKELQWDLSTAVAKEIQANWHLLQGANKEVQLVWNSAGSTSQGLQLNWTLQTDSVRIPLHVMVIKKQNRIMKILH